MVLLLLLLPQIQVATRARPILKLHVEMRGLVFIQVGANDGAEGCGLLWKLLELLLEILLEELLLLLGHRRGALLVELLMVLGSYGGALLLLELWGW